MNTKTYTKNSRRQCRPPPYKLFINIISMKNTGVNWQIYKRIGVATGIIFKCNKQLKQPMYVSSRINLLFNDLVNY